MKLVMGNCYGLEAQLRSEQLYQDRASSTEKVGIQAKTNKSSNLLQEVNSSKMKKDPNCGK